MALMPKKLGNAGKAVAAGLGYAVSEYAPLFTYEPVGGVRLGTIVGAYLWLKGKGDALKFLGLGMVMPDVKDIMGSVLAGPLEAISMPTMGGGMGGSGGSTTEAP